MTPDQLETAVIFAVVAPTLYGAHAVADHWVQSHNSSCRKTAPGPSGAAWCLWHVTTYLVTCLTAVVGASAALGLLGALSPVGLAVGMAVNGASHYLADRRVPLVWMARATGHGGWIDSGDPEAAYKLDQSWHIGWLLVSALITATL